MHKQIWYEVYLSQVSPRIIERLVVKETTSMVTYETTSRHWNTRALKTYLHRHQKVSEHREFYQSREKAINRFKEWCNGRAELHENTARGLRDAASEPTIEHLNTESI